MANRSIYIRDRSLNKWVEENVKRGRFRSYSHAVEEGLKLLKLRTTSTPKPF